MFWTNFYNLCVSAGTSPNAVCKELGFSSATSTHWKNGTTPNGDAIVAIANRFGCSTDYLLGRTSDSKTTYENVQSSNIVNVNGNNGDYSPLTVNKISDEDKELLKLIQNLSLKQKAKIITYIYEIIETE